MSLEKRYLQQWVALKDEAELVRVSKLAKMLFLLGAGLTVIVAFLIFLNVSPILIAIVAAAIGWTISESNALHTRIKLWPVLKRYLDWDAINKNSGQ